MGAEGATRVVPLGAADAPRIVAVFVDAFHDYPVMRYVLGESAEYEGRLRRLIGFFVENRVRRGEPLLGVAERDELLAAATMSFPGGESPPELAALREQVWTELGADARARYEACGEAWKPLGVQVPHVHLNMLGAVKAAQGRGLGRALLRHAHRISLETPGSEGVTLTTENPANVPFYRHLGYEVVGHARIAPGVETWGMFRRTL